MADETVSIEHAPRDGVPAARPFLFVAFTGARPLDAPHRYALEELDEVLLGRGDPSAARAGRRLELRLPDPAMSAPHARLARRDERWIAEDLRSKNGTWINAVAQARATLADGDLLELGQSFLLFRELREAAADGPAAAHLGVATLLPALAAELARGEALAASAVRLVILGETGTGKELVARAAHAASGRAGAFVPVNCAALPATLVESELFGHKRGAFSGAVADRVGLISAAHRGTLFLDEIGELRAEAQAALLRVLETGELLPIGATTPRPIDVRVVAATNRDLPALVAQGQFRADLYARLAGFVLRLPPLAGRREDLGLIVAALLRRLAPGDAGRLTFAPAAARRLFQHGWPMNVRELDKALASALVLSGGRIEPGHLRLGFGAADSAAPAPLSDEHAERRARLVALLREHDGNISAVARAMGRERVQIRRWLRMYGLDAKPRS